VLGCFLWMATAWTLWTFLNLNKYWLSGDDPPVQVLFSWTRPARECMDCVQRSGAWAVNWLGASVGCPSPKIMACHSKVRGQQGKAASNSFEFAKVLIRGLLLPQLLSHPSSFRVLQHCCPSHNLLRELAHGTSWHLTSHSMAASLAWWHYL
jgi:hypothetical protein